jgi:UDP-glucose 4-epimerase
LTAERWPVLQTAVPGLREFTVLGDFGSNPIFGDAFDGVTSVIHLAGMVHVMRSDTANLKGEFHRINVDGTVNVATAAAKQGVRRFVFVSSIKVNGESTMGKPFTEGDVPVPQDPYAVSKWEAEEELRRISVETGLDVTIIRPPLVYGPGVRANFLRLLGLVRSGIPLPLPDNKNRRSLIGVENIADCLARCVMHPGAANQTFVISDGEDVSTRELVSRLGLLLGRPVRFLPVSERILRLAAGLVGKRSAVDRLLGSLEIDSSMVRQKLEWEPPVKLDLGLEATVSWYLDSLKQSA